MIGTPVERKSVRGGPGALLHAGPPRWSVRHDIVMFPRQGQTLGSRVLNCYSTPSHLPTHPA